MTHPPATFFVVSGLPASGKTTLGRQLASALGLRLLDKDAVLEAFFDSFGKGDAAWRTALDHASDDVLFRVAGGFPARSSCRSRGAKRSRRPPVRRRLHSRNSPATSSKCSAGVTPRYAARRFVEPRPTPRSPRSPGHLRRDPAALPPHGRGVSDRALRRRDGRHDGAGRHRGHGRHRHASRAGHA